MKKLVLFTFLSLSIFSCKKIAGPGGTSAIRGEVKGSSFNAGQHEILQIICTAGSEIEHGDYWLLNTGDASKQYYIYYANPTWISNADPQLQGRIGIMVSFNYPQIIILRLSHKNLNSENPRLQIHVRLLKTWKGIFIFIFFGVKSSA